MEKSGKNLNKKTGKDLQVLNLEKTTGKQQIADRSDTLKTIFTKPIKFLKIRDIKRGMSRLIQMYCRGEVLTDEAKTLTYLFSTYIQIISQFELEQRIQSLEDKAR